MTVEILVCQAGSCRRRGSEAVLMEIEELVSTLNIQKADEQCTVESSGCLGMCSRAPSALVIKQSGEELSFTRITDLEKSLRCVNAATGKVPRVDDPEVKARLSSSRAVRVREKAISLNRWNEALKATIDQMNTMVGNTTSNLKGILQSIYIKAGFQEELTPVQAPPPMPADIDSYSPWSLQNVEVVSKHSAVLSFTSNDRRRGTPHPRGKGRSPPSPRTWHVTMLAEIGWNEEGPLPWCERDYTPISTAKEWESGKCRILIKFYNDGKATSWLLGKIKNTSLPMNVFFSKPLPTLSVPGLVHSGNSAFYPSSVLLLLGGTGCVALPQVLHHRDPLNKLGIPTQRRSQMQVPMDLVLSCRADDILFLPEITMLCKQSQEESDIRGVRNCTLLLTKGEEASTCGGFTPPFDAFSGQSEVESMLNALDKLPNAEVIHSRLAPEMAAKALSRMPHPCRIVVSGPSGFNGAVRDMLRTLNVKDDQLTILEA